jgi:hypothetical protein
MMTTINISGPRISPNNILLSLFDVEVANATTVDFEGAEQ